MGKREIITVDAGNLDQHGMFCVGNKKHPGYVAKRAWLEKRFDEGLRLKVAYKDAVKALGFIEYVPAEYSFRVVENAEGFLMIHCLWVHSKKTNAGGLASALIKACAEEAAAQGKKGLAVVCSSAGWMAGEDIFLKNGFKTIDRYGPYSLLVSENFAGTAHFPVDWQKRLDAFDDLTLLYTNQCPYIGKMLGELPAVANRHGVKLAMIELNDALQARSLLASPYGMVNLVANRKLLADHAISATRFKNILKKDLGLEELAV